LETAGKVYMLLMLGAGLGGEDMPTACLEAPYSRKRERQEE
jgi:hypothetical protein